jgi:hypothetical protein
VLADCPRDVGRGLRRACVLPDYHAFPLAEQCVRPQEFMYAVFRKRQHRVHEDEREQYVGVDENTCHGYLSAF